MDPNFFAALELAGAMNSLSGAIYNLAWAVFTLSIVCMLGYWVALRNASKRS